VLCMEKDVDGLYLFVCKNYISLTCLNGFFARFNFDNILIKSNIFICSLFQHGNNSKKTVAEILKTKEKKSAKTRMLRNDCA
jgi:hypothetical protein